MRKPTPIKHGHKPVRGRPSSSFVVTGFVVCTLLLLIVNHGSGGSAPVIDDSYYFRDIVSDEMQMVEPSKTVSNSKAQKIAIGGGGDQETLLISEENASSNNESSPDIDTKGIIEYLDQQRLRIEEEKQREEQVSEEQQAMFSTNNQIFSNGNDDENESTFLKTSNKSKQPTITIDEAGHIVDDDDDDDGVVQDDSNAAENDGDDYEAFDVQEYDIILPTGQPFDPSRFGPEVEFLDALETCETFQCVHDAHFQPRGDSVYNYPHFLMIGWQKTATTSLHRHLMYHPFVSPPIEKEPEVLTEKCNYSLLTCPLSEQRRYVRNVLKMDRFLRYDGWVAPFEASTHLARGKTVQMLPTFVSEVHQHFPWLKIVASLREPISRAISMLVHMEDKHNKGCLSRSPLGYCLLHHSQITHDLAATNYSYPIKLWLDTYSPKQFHLIQYEELVTEQHEQEEVLQELKLFVDIDPTYPRNQSLPLTNSRKFRVNPEGWPIHKREYEQLIEIVKPDVDALMEIVEKHELGNVTKWRMNWETVWKENLATCDHHGRCKIQLS